VEVDREDDEQSGTKLPFRHPGSPQRKSPPPTEKVVRPYLDNLNQLRAGSGGQGDVLGARALRPRVRVLQGGVPHHMPPQGEGGIVGIQHVLDGSPGGRSRRPQVVRVLHGHVVQVRSGDIKAAALLQKASYVPMF